MSFRITRGAGMGDSKVLNIHLGDGVNLSITHRRLKELHCSIGLVLAKLAARHQIAEESERPWYDPRTRRGVL